MCFCKCQTSYSLSLFRSIVFLDPCPDVLLQMPDKLLYVSFQEYSLSWSASMETSCGQYLLECLSWYLGPRLIKVVQESIDDGLKIVVDLSPYISCQTLGHCWLPTASVNVFHWIDLLVLPTYASFGRILNSELLQNSFAAFPLLVSTHNAQPKVLTKCFCLLRHAEKDLECFFIIAPSVYWIGHIFYAFRLYAHIWELLHNNIKAYKTIWRTFGMS